MLAAPEFNLIVYEKFASQNEEQYDARQHIGNMVVEIVARRNLDRALVKKHEQGGN